MGWVGCGIVVFVDDGARVTTTDHSSAGRAEDCRVARLSLGRWFDSGWSEFLASFLTCQLGEEGQQKRHHRRALDGTDRSANEMVAIYKCLL